MKNLIAATLASLAFATAASAGGFAFNLPNLDFQTSETVTVSKGCLTPNAASDVCAPQE